MELTSTSTASTSSASLDQDVMLVNSPSYTSNDKILSTYAGSSQGKWSDSASVKPPLGMSDQVAKKAPPLKVKHEADKKRGNILKRAVHKIRKKRRLTSEAPVTNVEPPKVSVPTYSTYLRVLCTFHYYKPPLVLEK